MTTPSADHDLVDREVSRGPRRPPRARRRRGSGRAPCAEGCTGRRRRRTPGSGRRAWRPRRGTRGAASPACRRRPAVPADPSAAAARRPAAAPDAWRSCPTGTWLGRPPARACPCAPATSRSRILRLAHPPRSRRTWVPLPSPDDAGSSGNFGDAVTTRRTVTLMRYACQAMGRPKEHGEATREQLLETAARLLSERGSLLRLCTSGASRTMPGPRRGRSTAYSAPRRGSSRPCTGSRRRRSTASIRRSRCRRTPSTRWSRLGSPTGQSALEEPHLYGLLFGRVAPGFRPSEEDMRSAQRSQSRVVDALERAAKRGEITRDPWKIADEGWGLVHGLASLELMGGGRRRPRRRHGSALSGRWRPGSGRSDRRSSVHLPTAGCAGLIPRPPQAENSSMREHPERVGGWLGGLAPWQQEQTDG